MDFDLDLLDEALFDGVQPAHVADALDLLMNCGAELLATLGSLATAPPATKQLTLDTLPPGSAALLRAAQVVAESPDADHTSLTGYGTFVVRLADAIVDASYPDGQGRGLAVDAARDSVLARGAQAPLPSAAANVEGATTV